MQLDQLPSYVIVIAASIHAKLLDRAVWRRFQVRLAFPAPDRKQVEVFRASWPATPRVPIQKIADKLGAISYAEALDFCQYVRRRHILGLGEVGINDAVRTELDLPVPAVRLIIQRAPGGMAGLEPVMFIRPQSIASAIEVTDPEGGGEGAAPGILLGDPILALLDGVRVAAHRLLAAHLIVDDQFALEPVAPVADRIHGTAMAMARVPTIGTRKERRPRHTNSGSATKAVGRVPYYRDAHYARDAAAVRTNRDVAVRQT
jgi:hypothetical protein